MAEFACKMERTYKKQAEVQFWIDAESDFPDSETVPDGAKSMRELLMRHANGINDNVMLSYDYSGDIPDYRGLEPHELAELAQEAFGKHRDLQAIQEKIALDIRNQELAAKRERDIQLLKELKEREENG